MSLSRVTQFRNRANVGLLGLAFAVIAVTSVMSVRSMNALSDAVDVANHTVTVKDSLSAAKRNLDRLEAEGLRYMIDGSPWHRDGLESHLGAASAELVKLNGLVADHPKQLERLERLFDDIDSLQARVRQAIKIRETDLRQGDHDASLRRLRESGGEYLIERMRQNLDAMVLEEDRLLALRQGERDALIKQTNATLMIANGLALVAGMIGYFALRRAQREEENKLLTELRVAQAYRASEEKSAFLANMSHEIRTPMNAIFGFAQLLSDKVDEPLQKEWVAAIRKSGQMLLILINDVLDLSKIEAGKLQLNPQGTDIPEMVGEIVTLFEPMAEAKGVDLRYRVDSESMVPVAVDAPRLRQILMNLLSNAVKYTEKGEIEVEVMMRRSPLGDERDLLIRVTDTGTGIHPDQQVRIFEPFFQAESPDGKIRQGTGLGLSITKRLVDLMHGRIRVTSRLGEGATFTIELPQLAPAEPVVAAYVDEIDSPVDFDRLPDLRIQVVDDVEWNIEVVKGYLRDSRHRLAIARDGEEALAVASTFRPSVILMDLRMPKMDGYRALERMRANPALRAIPVLAVTASSMSDEHVPPDVRFDGYLRKPYSPKELLDGLIQVFGERQGPNASSEPEASVAAGDAPATQAMARDEALAEWRILRQAPLLAMRKRMRIREIGEFSKRLDVLARIIGDKTLIDEARTLRTAVQRFDVTRMKNVLDRLAGWSDEHETRPEDAENA